MLSSCALVASFCRSTFAYLVIFVVYTNTYLLQSVTTKEGNNFRTETVMGTDTSIRLYEFTDTGMIVVRERMHATSIFINTI